MIRQGSSLSKVYQEGAYAPLYRLGSVGQVIRYRYALGKSICFFGEFRFSAQRKEKSVSKANTLGKKDAMCEMSKN